MHTCIHLYVHTSGACQLAWIVSPHAWWAHTHTYTHSYIQTYIHTYTHQVPANWHGWLHRVYDEIPYTHIHTLMHTYIQTYIHTHIRCLPTGTGGFTTCMMRSPRANLSAHMWLLMMTSSRQAEILHTSLQVTQIHISIYTCLFVCGPYRCLPGSSVARELKTNWSWGSGCGSPHWDCARCPESGKSKGFP